MLNIRPCMPIIVIVAGGAAPVPAAPAPLERPGLLSGGWRDRDLLQTAPSFTLSDFLEIGGPSFAQSNILRKSLLVPQWLGDRYWEDPRYRTTNYRLRENLTGPFTICSD